MSTVEGVTCQLRTEFLDSLVPGPDRYPLRKLSVQRQRAPYPPPPSSPVLLRAVKTLAGNRRQLDRPIAY
jgi:hypothetical protein